jgi:hypothetical protein
VGNEIEVEPSALVPPAKRFGEAAGDVGQVSQAVQDALGVIGEAARHPSVSSAADAFGTAAGSALDAAAAHAQRLSTKLEGAANRYEHTDAVEVPADMAQATDEVAAIHPLDLR